MKIPSTAKKILDKAAIDLKLERMAYQILENTYGEKELCLVGIAEGGFDLLQNIVQIIQTIDNKIKIEITELTINKRNPTADKITLSKQLDFNNKTVCFIDDVANSGKTLYYAQQILANYSIKSNYIVVLIDRTHKKFPIKADIVGMPIATTLNEHIIVDFKQNTAQAAYLF
ncbi:MAG: phosphoribosyltransferase [Chitinophagales bacterium]|nr:phosphoribosyltransferase [Chitinophagales bacterium]